MQGSAMVKWTGRGRVEDLGTSTLAVLRTEFPKSKARLVGRCVELEGVEPAGAALLLRHTPGVGWIAAGHSADSLDGLAVKARRLAGAYLKRGLTFSVSSEARGRGPTPSDLGGLLTSAILGEVSGARVNDDDPVVRFRSAYDDGHGVVGIELSAGPGGTPTGKRWADCLVSGGMHSSVAAWHALLAGFRLRLIHHKESEESLKEVARLYAELSERTDPKALRLIVQEGGTLEGLASRRQGTTLPFAGVHFECGGVPAALEGKVLAPLALLTEEEFERSHRELSIGRVDGRHEWGSGPQGRQRLLSFGGTRADVHGVLDGLR